MVAVRRCLRLGIVKGLRGGWAFPGVSSTDLVFLVFLTVGFFLGCLVDVSVGRGFFVHFVVVFSARALGAGFRPGVFLPRFPPP